MGAPGCLGACGKINLGGSGWDAPRFAEWINRGREKTPGGKESDVHAAVKVVEHIP